MNNVTLLDPETIMRLRNEASTMAATITARTVPAAVGGEPGVTSLDVYGNSFYLVKSGGAVRISSSGDASTADKIYSQGQGENFPELFRFKRLEIKNYNAFPVAIYLWAGFGEYVDKNINVAENPSVLVGSNFTTLPAAPGPGNSVTLSGNPVVSGYLRRKSVIISNLDPVNPIEFTDGSNAAGVVFPRSIVELITSGPVTVTNPTGAAMSYRLSEIWYLA